MIMAREGFRTAFEILAREEGIPAGSVDDLVGTALPIYSGIKRRIEVNAGCQVAGICGAQGSGKTTIAKGLTRALQQDGLAVVAFSLDDLYLSSAARKRLASEVHPLLKTRGVPGTHDIGRGLAVIDSLGVASPDQETSLPCFNKGQDEPCPPEQETIFRGRPDVILIEGWCVGARPQAADELVAPINALEREQDPDGIWRRYVNEQLAGPYQEFFGKMGFLALIRAPDFEQVFTWRTLQEQKLAERQRALGRDPRDTSIMGAQELEVFIRHYERLTRHILNEMPTRADVTIQLDKDRRCIEVRSG